MDVIKYLAFDLHIATITYVVMSMAGRVLEQGVFATSALGLRSLIKRIRGQLEVTFEEGTLSQWAYEILQPMVKQVIVCNPRRNKYLAEGNKGDRIDTLKLADLLRTGMLKAVYHEPAGRGIKDLVGFYLSIVVDTTRVMNRLRSVFRSRGVQTNRTVYSKRGRDSWLAKLEQRPAKRQRAEMLYRQMDCLRDLRREGKRKMLAAARVEKGYKILISIPGLGPIRVAILLGILVTPFRFASKRQLWTYGGLSVVSRTSSDYEIVNGRPVRVRRKTDTRGLTRDFNRTLKYVLKGATTDAIRKEPFKEFYRIRINKGIAPENARLIVARKIAALILALWKKGGTFDTKVMLNLTA